MPDQRPQPFQETQRAACHLGGEPAGHASHRGLTSLRRRCSDGQGTDRVPVVVRPATSTSDKMAGVGVHVIHSLSYGELRVVATPGSYGHGRTWRALLDPVPIGLRRHLTSFDGVGELEVLSGLLRQMDRYDREGAHARQSESDPEQ